MNAHARALFVLGSLSLLLAIAPSPLEGPGGMVSSDHQLASRAGAEMLAQGGNAVDAAVATALACGVVQPAGSGLGGGGFAVVHDQAGSAVLDFREVAPKAGHADMYLDPQGQVIPKASQDGGLAVAVPGEGRGLAQLLAEHGTMTPKQVARPAIRLAKGGFDIEHHLLTALGAKPAMVALFDSGTMPGLGDPVRRTKLSRTLNKWASSAGEALYTGAIAQDVVDSVQAQGGVLTLEDLADYQPVSREVLVGHYRGYTILTMPPPSSGGAVLLQVLGVLEGFELPALGHNSSEHLHLLAESMQHAYADRAQFMGDPDFVPVPVERMLEEERILQIRSQIWPLRSFDRDYYGSPVSIPEDSGTQHIAVIDASGNAVALTTTINTSFGSKVIAGQSGLLLNNEMDDFVALPGVPNAYGLVGQASNAVAPGKKPLSSMTPTLVLGPDGQVVMAIGASGGPLIISSTLQVLSNVIDFGMDPEEAVSAPRMHHQWVPEVLSVEPGIPVDVQHNLETRGHELKEWTFFSSVQLVVVEDGVFVGAADPRKGGKPALP